jgi:hypothetical protein
LMDCAEEVCNPRNAKSIRGKNLFFIKNKLVTKLETNASIKSQLIEKNLSFYHSHRDSACNHFDSNTLFSGETFR